MSGTPSASLENKLINKRDEILVKAAVAGDSKAFEQLMEFYKKRVTALGMSFFRNPEDTDDFVQEVFVKVYIHLSSFKFNSSFGTWITRIAYNSAVNSISRRQEYIPLAQEEMLVGKERSPEEEQIRKVTLDAIRESVSDLPENYGMCVEMYFFHGLKYEEISEITDFPVNTIKSHIFRAKKILAKKLRGIYE